MNVILSIPMTARLALFFVIGAILGAAANAMIYGQRFAPRPISPWLAPSAKAPLRRWFDRVPVFGWLALRREAFLHGPGFWIRPLLVELFLGIGFAALYNFEINGGLLPEGIPRAFLRDHALALHLQFIAHIVLIFWMTAAALIDVDETVIPDVMTISGTLCGLLLAGIAPHSLLPDVFPLPNVFPQKLECLFLNLASPSAWPAALDFPRAGGLAVGIGCWLSWCFALLPWYGRSCRQAMQLCFILIRRERSSQWILGLSLLGSIAITGCWRLGGDSWQGLLSALVGMAAGGAIIWAVRIIGGAVMQREAMGFGDVTLMAMIGSFLGWQTSLVVFFLAPFAALVFGVLRLLLFREKAMPYGPFLCIAAVYTIIAWDDVWNYIYPIFSVGWLVPVVLVGCFAVMPLLLIPIRWIVSRFA